MSPTPSPLLPVVLAETERTRVTRVAGPTGPLIRKEALGRGAGRRLRHEAKILQRLAGVQGVVQLAAAPDVEHKADVEHETDIKESSGSILLEDINGTALSGWRTPLGPDLLLAVAEALARAVAGMHHRGVVHRDISPANVVATPDGDVCLIDFALATTLTSMRSEFTHHAAIIGTVPYLAPEQTGRTSRPIDHRADLYAVGATLYELAAGAPPFGRTTRCASSTTTSPGCRYRRRNETRQCPVRWRRSSRTCSRRSPMTATRAPRGSHMISP
ncbi:protein kinase domain-containing protein [Parafrankia sp. CH37]|uniref:protein kinase domain-containing protein n=1 Tax=Parafrankia sp. CH37 TaxID=683308 RepID=UPI001D021523|nr:protein kinase [Parafrankia sp. CH37]